MTYVTDQTSAELRAHMRSLKRMQGWHEPLADRLFKEVVEQDATIKKLEGALAAAEARNATLTDDAAPADPMDWRLPCDVTVGHGTMRKGVKLRTLVTRMKVLYEMATGNNADEVSNRTPEQNAALAGAFQARAAASISTKGDGHG